jgi:AcrR family transcriptional regulator
MTAGRRPLRRTAPAPAAPPAPAARRTQAERREGTRQKLLDATVALLVEAGYARTTTIAVAQRAGTSQGALFKHFPTRGALLGAAVEALFPRLISEYRAVLARVPPRGDRAGASIELLWAVYQRPELQAAVELFVAARCDPELADVLARVNPPHREALRQAARALFPEAAASPHFDGAVELALYAVQGVATECMALPAGPSHRKVLEVLAALLRPFLEPQAPRPGPSLPAPTESPVSAKRKEAVHVRPRHP